MTPKSVKISSKKKKTFADAVKMGKLKKTKKTPKSLTVSKMKVSKKKKKLLESNANFEMVNFYLVHLIIINNNK